MLRLYVSGMTPLSLQAIANVQELCRNHLQGRHSIEIVDIFQQPDLASEGKVIAVPTLDKISPPPLRRFVGDLSQTERLLKEMDLDPEP